MGGCGFQPRNSRILPILAKSREDGSASTRRGGSARQRAVGRPFADVRQNEPRFAEHWQNPVCTKEPRPRRLRCPLRRVTPPRGKKQDRLFRAPAAHQAFKATTLSIESGGGQSVVVPCFPFCGFHAFNASRTSSCSAVPRMAQLDLLRPCRLAPSSRLPDEYRPEQYGGDKGKTAVIQHF